MTDPATGSVKFSLPLNPSVPEVNFSRFYTLLYGPPKIGKSTLASTYPDALFISTEPGLNFLEVLKTDCRNWIEFRNIVKQLRMPEAKERYKTIVVDTVDLLYLWCEQFVCDTKGIEHPSDEDYGKGWAFVREEFQKGCGHIVSEGYGVVFISHVRETEVKIGGVKVSKAIPSISNQARKVILPLVDFMLYLAPDIKAPESGRRVIYTRPTAVFEAGCRQKYFPAEIEDIDYRSLADALALARSKETAERR